MESNFFYNTHFDYIEHWQRYERHNILFQRLINILTQANWNKRIVRNPHFILMSNDLEIHRNRFSRYIKTVETIANEMKLLNVNYNEGRINKIITILTKIKNYEN